MIEKDFINMIIHSLDEKKDVLEKDIQSLYSRIAVLNEKREINTNFQIEFAIGTLNNRNITDYEKIVFLKNFDEQGGLRINYASCSTEINEKTQHLNEIVSQLRLLYEQKAIIDRDAPPDDLAWQFDARKFHSSIVDSSRDLFVKNAPFQAAAEAAKTYVKQVGTKAKSTLDGYNLMDNVFGDKGVLKINNGKTKSEKNEQKGMKDLSCGVIAAFRNVLQHEPDSEFPLDSRECLEILSIFSYLFRKLDMAMSIELPKDTEPKQDSKTGGSKL